ncbi:hypothetical protein BC938DRAFT_477342 [Jimgerdemannia flammicorona]|uniref:Major facilitator superfamily (MFS) profile domain-containing protein n=1 Tax=Jimgerdemannia flammicorona TaxID=994334 RepID=A0A433QPF7_9FUNG|nr:hypothetical protein BC938DRAFT_477342 [Jimgerdemannia flammicorona]
MYICSSPNLGNVGVSKSVLGEITDNTNQPMAFALFGFCWGIGGIAGPVLGGLLSWPATQFPTLFGTNAFLIRFPYFLPCLVSAIISLLGFVVGYLFFEETNPRIIFRDAGKGPAAPTPRVSEKSEMRELDTAESGRKHHHHIVPVPLDIRRVRPNFQHLVQDFAGSVSTTASTIAEIASGFGVPAHEDEEDQNSIRFFDDDNGEMTETHGDIMVAERVVGRFTDIGDIEDTMVILVSEETDERKKIEKVSIDTILAYTILAFHCMIFDELFKWV